MAARQTRRSTSFEKLIPAWLAASLIVAAMICNSRLKLLRSPALIRLALIGSCAVFYVYVTRGVVI